MTLTDKEMKSLIKKYTAYKKAQREWEMLRDELCKDLPIGKYISEFGVINKIMSTCKSLDKNKLVQNYPDLNLDDYETKKEYTAIKVSLRLGSLLL